MKQINGSSEDIQLFQVLTENEITIKKIIKLKKNYALNSGKIGGHVQTRCLSPYKSSILPTLGHILFSARTNGYNKNS